MGSFCNAWAWRIVNKESISKGRSHCTSCGHTLYAKDLVPLFSWIFLKGKCRYCGAEIPKRYPLAELISLMWYIGVVYANGISIQTLRLLIIGSLLLVSSLVDIDTFELPDGFTIAIAALSLLRLVNDISCWKDMLLGLIVPICVFLIVLIMDKIKGMETMGGGDIKLIAALSLHFGLKGSLFFVIASCIAGLLLAVITKKQKDTAFPFGPMLMVGAFLTATVAEKAISMYLSLFV